MSFLIPGREIELSNPEDAITIATGDDPASPYWNFALDVPTTTDPLSVGIGLADRDPGEVDDLADITPDSATKGVTIDIDLSTGTWPGAPLAQQCFTGEGTDAVMLCVAVSGRSTATKMATGSMTRSSCTGTTTTATELLTSTSRHLEQTCADPTSLSRSTG